MIISLLYVIYSLLWGDWMDNNIVYKVREELISLSDKRMYECKKEQKLGRDI